MGNPMETNARPFIRQDGINWISLTAFTLFHVGAVAALFFFTWPAVFTAVALYWISLSLGIGMGYHRLLTHRSYKTPKWVEYFLATCGTLALEGGPMFWVATIASITSSPTRKAIRTPRATASGGVISAGCWLATPPTVM